MGESYQPERDRLGKRIPGDPAPASAPPGEGPVCRGRRGGGAGRAGRGRGGARSRRGAQPDGGPASAGGARRRTPTRRPRRPRPDPLPQRQRRRRLFSSASASGLRPLLAAAHPGAPTLRPALGRAVPCCPGRGAEGWRRPCPRPPRGTCGCCGCCCPASSSARPCAVRPPAAPVSDALGSRLRGAPGSGVAGWGFGRARRAHPPRRRRPGLGPQASQASPSPARVNSPRRDGRGAGPPRDSSGRGLSGLLGGEPEVHPLLVFVWVREPVGRCRRRAVSERAAAWSRSHGRLSVRASPVPAGLPAGGRP